MNADLARWMLRLPFGMMTKEDLQHLVSQHRLCLVLVRLGAAGRFMAPAQDVATLIEYATKAGDYVRDVSICREELESARAFKPEPPKPPRAGADEVPGKVREPAPQRIPVEFDESQCGGAFDGNQVTSDADPGL